MTPRSSPTSCPSRWWLVMAGEFVLGALTGGRRDEQAAPTTATTASNRQRHQRSPGAGRRLRTGARVAELGAGVSVVIEPVLSSGGCVASTPRLRTRAASSFMTGPKLGRRVTLLAERAWQTRLDRVTVEARCPIRSPRNNKAQHQLDARRKVDTDRAGSMTPPTVDRPPDGDYDRHGAWGWRRATSPGGRRRWPCSAPWRSTACCRDRVIVGLGPTWLVPLFEGGACWCIAHRRPHELPTPETPSSCGPSPSSIIASGQRRQRGVVGRARARPA